MVAGRHSLIKSVRSILLRLPPTHLNCPALHACTQDEAQHQHQHLAWHNFSPARHSHCLTFRQHTQLAPSTWMIVTLLFSWDMAGMTAAWHVWAHRREIYKAGQRGRVEKIRFRCEGKCAQVTYQTYLPPYLPIFVDDGLGDGLVFRNAQLDGWPWSWQYNLLTFRLPKNLDGNLAMTWGRTCSRILLVPRASSPKSCSLSNSIFIKLYSSKMKWW